MLKGAIPMKYDSTVVSDYFKKNNLYDVLEDFGCSYMEYEDFKRAAEKLKSKHDSGYTKRVFILKEIPWVIKLNFYEDGYNGDACGDEACNYQKAVEMGIDKILLPTALFYVDSCGHKYYCQPQFQPKPFHNFKYRVNSVVEDKSYALANKFYKSKFRFCHQWLAQAIVYYGYDFMRQVAKWTQICHVNDLHSGNVTMFNGRPIILDYSGVKQSCCSDS